MKKAVLSLSGGMDSSTLLLHLLANGYEVTALSFDYGQKHRVELERAQSLVSYLNSENWNVTHQIIKLDGLTQLLNSALVEGGKDVPEGHYEQDNMKETVVPNRNKIFASLIQAVALSVATKGEKQECVIAMGIHAGDHAIYPDCRQEFRDADFEAFKVGNWDSELVSHYTPYLHTDKFGILQDGEKCCEVLDIDFDEVYKRTNTSYKPIEVEKGFWVSDFKSAASVERIEAFIKLGRPDPVLYGEKIEDGIRIVQWDEVKSHVDQVLLEHKRTNI
jgi:7-cyano-7-deazaguanine synthase